MPWKYFCVHNYFKPVRSLIKLFFYHFSLFRKSFSDFPMQAAR